MKIFGLIEIVCVTEEKKRSSHEEKSYKNIERKLGKYNI